MCGNTGELSHIVKDSIDASIEGACFGRSGRAFFIWALREGSDSFGNLLALDSQFQDRCSCL